MSTSCKRSAKLPPPTSELQSNLASSKPLNSIVSKPSTSMRTALGTSSMISQLPIGSSTSGSTQLCNLLLSHRCEHTSGWVRLFNGPVNRLADNAISGVRLRQSQDQIGSEGILVCSRLPYMHLLVPNDLQKHSSIINNERVSILRRIRKPIQLRLGFRTNQPPQPSASSELLSPEKSKNY